MKAGIEQKFIKIGEQDYSIKKSARAYLKFEEITGHSIDSYDGSTKDAFSFLYSCLWGGGSRISYEDFLDLIDNEDVNKLIASFVKKMSEPVSEKKQTVR
jgi:hypothetical protein